MSVSVLQHFEAAMKRAEELRDWSRERGHEAEYDMWQAVAGLAELAIKRLTQ
jgi:hypothetical protein